MEKNRNSKVIAIAALLVAVVGLSLGFAAFSNTLHINSSANVTPTNTFSVDFSSSDTALEINPVTPVKFPTTILATDATIENNIEPTITGLSATFSEPGQSATYTFYATNNGEYDAFLKSITYANAADATSFRVCTAEQDSGATDSLVQAACDDIQVSVQVGADTATTGSVPTITQHSLLKGAFEPVVVKIEYLANGDRADGNFSVAFGDISLLYSSVD